MILSLRHLLGWVIGALGSRRDLLLEILHFVSNSYPCMPSVPAIGRNEKRLLFWLRHEPWWSGIALAFACIGNGSPERGRLQAESRSLVSENTS